MSSIKDSFNSGASIGAFVTNESQDVLEKRKAKFQTSEESVKQMIQADHDSLLKNKRKALATANAASNQQKKQKVEGASSSTHITDDVKKMREEKFK